MKNTICITGASSGIGKAYAEAYAKKGNDLVLIARSTEKLIEIEKQLSEKYGIEVQSISMDLSKENAAKQLMQEIDYRNISFNTLINNAGTTVKGFFHTNDYKKQNASMMLNIITLTELSYIFLERAYPNDKGTLINIASAAAFGPGPFSAVYAASKAYVLSFTEALVYEYRHTNISIYAVCPGATDTNFFNGYAPMPNMRTPENVVKTTFKALKKQKTVAVDGGISKARKLLPRILSRNMVTHINGKVAENLWGQTKC